MGDYLGGIFSWARGGGATTGAPADVPSSNPSEPPSAWAATAAATGRIEALRWALQLDPSVAESASLLHTACGNGQLECARLLLDAGASADALDRRRDTPLTVACGSGHVHCAALLLQRGALLQPEALVRACSRGHLACAELLLAQGEARAEPRALLRACVKGHAHCAKALLDAGADASGDRSLTPPLIAAVWSEHLACVQLLLSRGADPNAHLDDGNHDEGADDDDSDDDDDDDDGDGGVPSHASTALVAACLRGNDACVEHLLAHGADTRSHDALDAACKAGHGACVERLVAARAGARDALIHACKRDLARCAALLLGAGYGAGEPGRNALYVACSSSSAECLGLLVEHGVDASASLADAVLGTGDWLACVTRLLDASPRADPNAPSKTLGMTPLTAACSRPERCAAVRLLLAAGAEIDRADAMGNTPLRVASRTGELDCVRALLKAGASGAPSAPYALIDACAAGHFECAAVLVCAGVDATARTPGRGLTALHAAAVQRKGAVTARLLLDANAEVTIDTLWSACEYDCAECVAVLAEAGGARVVDNLTFGATPLMRAASLGHAGCVRALLKAGAKTELTHRLDGGHSTALRDASVHGHLECVQLLLGAEADPNGGKVPALVGAKDERIVRALLASGADVERGAPLHWACKHDRPRVVWELLRAGARVDQRWRQRTPLMAASRAGSVASVQHLLASGAELDAVDAHGRTALMHAAVRGSAGCVRALVRAGAALNAADRNGHRALMLADEHSDEVARVLLDAGAALNLEDHEQQTALSLAAKRKGGAQRMRDLLLAGAPTRNSFGAYVLCAEKEGLRVLETAEQERRSGGAEGAEPPLDMPLDASSELAAATEAAATGRVAALRWLLLCRPPRDGREIDQLLQAACTRGQLECTRLLLEAAASAPPPHHAAAVAARALRHACASGHTRCAKLLLEAAERGPPLAPGCTCGMCFLDELERDFTTWGPMARAACAGEDGAPSVPTPREEALHAACAAGQLECLELLLLGRARAGTHALQLACAHGHALCVRALLDAGVPPDEPAGGGGDSSPLIAACREWHPACVQLLLERGADVNRRHGDAWPLRAACEARSPTCVELLLAHGADPSLTSSSGRATALHIACELGEDSCVALLLRAHAAAAPAAGELELAVLSRNAECVRRLLAAGCRVTASALCLACREGSLDCLDAMLGANGAAALVDTSPLASADTPLVTACRTGHLACAARLLEAGAAPNQRGEGGWTPLAWAATQDSVALSLLLGSKADPDLLVPPGLTTALRLASRRNCVESVRALLRAGAARGLVEALGDACQADALECAEELLKAGVDPNARDEAGVPALVRACTAREGGCIALLLAAGADPNLRDGTGSTALMAAVSGGGRGCHHRVRQLLLSGRVDVRLMRTLPSVDGGNEEEVTALWLACRAGCARSARALAEATGGETADREQAHAALLVAVGTRHTPCVRALVARGGAGVPASADALRLAVGQDQHECVRLLLEAGADGADALNEARSGAVTRLLGAGLRCDANAARALLGNALHVACSRARAPVVWELLRAGAHPDAREWDGTTPLMTACEVGASRCVEHLLEAGADVHARREAPLPTALMAAASAAAGAGVACVRWLLRAGARVDEVDTAQRSTALMHAVVNGRLGSVKELIGAHASLDAADATGRTALMLAAERGDAQLMRELLNAGAAALVPDERRLPEECQRVLLDARRARGSWK